MTSTSQDSGKKLRIYGHASASPQRYGEIVGAEYSSAADPTCDAAIFAINPAAGIDAETIELWHAFDEFQTPRMVIVTVMDGVEMDFDDAVLLANRVFDPLVTPYLVLHGDNGGPIGTIALDDLSTRDYSHNPPIDGHADDELTELVKDFQDEYNEHVIEMGQGAFAAGILFPALPVNSVNGLGLDRVKEFLDQLPSSS